MRFNPLRRRQHEDATQSNGDAEKQSSQEELPSSHEQYKKDNEGKPVGFWNPGLREIRHEAMGKWVLTTAILMTFIFACMSIYWAVFFNLPQNLSSLVIYVADFDGRVAPYTNVQPIVGPAITELAAQTGASTSGNKLGWTVVSISDFNNDPIQVRQAVYDWHAWAAIIINPNATAMLQSAVQTGNTSYDPLGAVQLIYQSARDNTAWFDYIYPLVTSFQTEATTTVGELWAKQVLANATLDTTLLANIARVPQALSPAIGFSQYDLRSFSPYTATPAVSIGLIYLIIMAFFSFSWYLPIHQKVSGVIHLPFATLMCYSISNPKAALFSNSGSSSSGDGSRLSALTSCFHSHTAWSR